MREIAVYGKGGIGKSTVSANLSAALASLGRRVLQIGCDPKHDSTRLLTRGMKQTTALDYMRVTTPPDYRLEDILLTGFGGVGCIEAGGPQPGVGCAGRGIISTFELLERWKLKDSYDYILYDVLGDVVCGGFAVPIRREYADTVFIVTSGEYMSLYAANNILRGVRNYDGDARRTAGIIYNRRNIEDEDGRVLRFAEAVGLPICAEIPRSEAFSEAERLSMTVIEHNADAAVRGIFTDLAARIMGGADGKMPPMNLYEAKPLEDDELERTVLNTAKPAAPQPTDNRQRGRPEAAVPAYGIVNCHGASGMPRPTSVVNSPAVSPKITTAVNCPLSTVNSPAAPSDETRYLSKNVVRGEPLHGCAFNGAMTVCSHIRDAAILAHSPKSCAYITLQTVTSTGRRTLFERGALLPVSLAPHIECTDMGETEAVFGGMEKLREKVIEIQSRSPRAVIVVSACPAGIIGDDIDQVRALSRQDMPVVTVKADGNMTGDFLQGLMTSCVSLARQIIKRDVDIVPNTVNIVAEKIILTNTEKNFGVIKGFLKRMGVSVNCRFVYDTDFDSLSNFCTARINLPAFRDYGGQMFESFLKTEYGCEFFDMAFPIGFYETCQWLRGVSGYFGAEDTAEEIISENTLHYKRGLEALRPALAGKRLMIITYNHELDWILEPAIDLGMEIVKLGILNFSQDEGFRMRLTVPLPAEESYDREKRAGDIAKYRPDILLTNYQSSAADGVPLADTIPMCPDAGFFSGLDMARRWARLLNLNQKGEWRHDAGLLDKYYA